MSEFSDLNALMVPSTPAFVPTAFKALYRKSDVGIALTDTIDALIEQGKLDEAAGLESMYFALQEKAKSDVSFSGHLDSYGLVDSVWTFEVEDATFKFNNGTTVRSDRVKIVAMKAYDDPNNPSSATSVTTTKGKKKATNEE